MLDPICPGPSSAGVLHARVVRPPSPGASLESVDTESVREQNGVVAIVRDGSFLGVVAEREEQAIKAREALVALSRWTQTSTLPPQETLHEWLLSQPTQTFLIADGVGVAGDVFLLPMPEDAIHTLEATYTKPYHMHGAIGPSAALAQWSDGRLTVWTHSQAVATLRQALAEAFEIDPATVRVTHVVGPGYWHTTAPTMQLSTPLCWPAQ